MIKFLIFLLFGLYLVRTFLIGFVRFFIAAFAPPKKSKPSETSTVKKEGPNSKNIGEYIDYEEID